MVSADGEPVAEQLADVIRENGTPTPMRRPADTWKFGRGLARSLSLGATASLILGVQVAAAQNATTNHAVFTKDIAAIVFNKCSVCHHPGGSAPFSLLTYEDVKRHAAQIGLATKTRFMPPWRAESTGQFLGQRSLTDQEIDVIQNWVGEGAPEGDRADLPNVPQWPDGWQLGRPDLILPFPAGYTLPAEGPDVFRVFVVHVPTDSIRYVRALEFRPGNPTVVHHADIRLDPTTTSRRFDEQDPEPGYAGLLALTAAYPDGHLLGWSPGELALPVPKGLEWRLEPGTDFVIQLHMKPSGRPEVVQPSIGLFFSADPPQRTPAMLRLGRQAIDIPPGDSAYIVTDTFVLPVDVQVQAIQPHAHYRGRQMHAVAKLPDGTSRSLISIKEWDFNWQQLYQFATPITLPKGTVVEMRYTYDNSADNPRNPQLPPRRVYWGQESTDEMGDLWLQVLTRDDRDLAVLNTQVRAKMAAEDIVGYETAIRSDPTNVALHDDAAQMYLELGSPDGAVTHFRASASLQPDSPAAQFNLGIALVAAGRLDDAISADRLALQLKPDYALARMNLAYALMMRGNLDDAIEQYRAAARGEPASAPAHNNLGSALLQRDEIDEALSEFREALRIDPASAEAHYNIARASLRQGGMAAALLHYRQSVQLKPDWAAPLTEMAWILATSPDGTFRNGSEAVRFAEQAVSLTRQRSATTLDVLGAAYAEEGLFDRAIETVEIALALTADGPMRADLQQRRELYKQHRPYRLKSK
jgi:tetratricopeptide (TPR) repeat protein